MTNRRLSLSNSLPESVASRPSRLSRPSRPSRENISIEPTVLYTVCYFVSDNQDEENEINWQTSFCLCFQIKVKKSEQGVPSHSTAATDVRPIIHCCLAVKQVKSCDLRNNRSLDDGKKERKISWGMREKQPNKLVENKSRPIEYNDGGLHKSFAVFFSDGTRRARHSQQPTSSTIAAPFSGSTASIDNSGGFFPPPNANRPRARVVFSSVRTWTSGESDVCLLFGLEILSKSEKVGNKLREEASESNIYTCFIVESKQI